jgi:hypothetical protein
MKEWTLAKIYDINFKVRHRYDWKAAASDRKEWRKEIGEDMA